MGDSVAGRPNDMHDSSHAVRHAVSGSFRRLHTATVPQHRQPPAPAAPIIHLLLPPHLSPFPRGQLAGRTTTGLCRALQPPGQSTPILVPVPYGIF